MNDVTIFDRIITREVPADIVFEDEDVLAFRDVKPQAPVHVLVIPKAKMRGFAMFRQSDPQVVGRFISKVSEVAHRLNLEEKGYRIVINEGRDGQQSVEYVHAHILAGRPLTWPPG